MKAKVIVKKETEYEVEFPIPCYTKSYSCYYKIYGSNKKDAIKIILPDEYWGATIEECNIETALLGNESITPEQFYEAYEKASNYIKDLINK